MSARGLSTRAISKKEKIKMYTTSKIKTIKVNGIPVQYRKVTYQTDSGLEYLDIYQYICPDGLEYEVERKLIKSVIGEDYYYSQRGIWEQIWFRKVENFNNDNL
jgi:hypothetical protein